MKYIENKIIKTEMTSLFKENGIPLPDYLINYFNFHKMLSISDKVIKEYEVANNEITYLVNELLSEILDGKYLEYFNYNEKEWEIIINSLAEHSYLAFRYDWGYHNKPKLYEINADSCGFLLECSIILEKFTKECNWNNNYNFTENYIKKIINNLNIKNDDILYLSSSGNYIFDEQILYLIKNKIKNKSIIINMDNIKCFEKHLYHENNKIEKIHKIYPWEWMINRYEEYSQTKFSEPVWTVLLNSKIILYLLWKKFPNNPYLIETYYKEDIKDKFVEKKLYGMQGEFIRLNYGNKKWEDSILQKFITPIEIDKDFLVFTTWTINNKFSGFGIKASKTIISDYNHKFIPISIEY